MTFSSRDQQFMLECIRLAQAAAEQGEVPVGAIIVNAQGVVASGFNAREGAKNPLAHAEIVAIEAAAKSLQRWRLTDCTLYVSLEPCAMCAGALINARVARLVYGASDPKGGCAGSLMNLCEDSRFNHKVVVEGGLMAEESGLLLSNFFRQRRKQPG